MGSEFSVSLTREAARYKDKQDRPTRARLDKAIAEIKEDPYKAGIPLKAHLKGHFKYRVGDFRIIYKVENDQLVIYVMRINSRGSVYKT